MAHRLTVSLNYATHLPALMRAMALSTWGPVLELGLGLFSTPYLHYECARQKRDLRSYENDAGWAGIFIEGGYRTGLHQIKVTADWSKVNLAVHWGVALVDNSPDDTRVGLIEKLQNYAQYLIIHDSNGRFENQYHYSTIYPLFKYRTDWTGDGRHAAVLSNFVDLGDFWK